MLHNSFIQQIPFKCSNFPIRFLQISHNTTWRGLIWIQEASFTMEVWLHAGHFSVQTKNFILKSNFEWKQYFHPKRFDSVIAIITETLYTPLLWQMQQWCSSLAFVSCRVNELWLNESSNSSLMREASEMWTLLWLVTNHSLFYSKYGLCVATVCDTCLHLPFFECG